MGESFTFCDEIQPLFRKAELGKKYYSSLAGLALVIGFMKKLWQW